MAEVVATEEHLVQAMVEAEGSEVEVGRVLEAAVVTLAAVALVAAKEAHVHRR